MMTLEASMRGTGSVEVRSERVGGAIKIVVNGEIDIATVERIAGPVYAAIEERPDAVVIDLEQVEFLETRFVKLLADTTERAARGGVGLVVLPPDGPAKRALAIAQSLLAHENGHALGRVSIG